MNRRRFLTLLGGAVCGLGGLAAIDVLARRPSSLTAVGSARPTGPASPGSSAAPHPSLQPSIKPKSGASGDDRIAAENARSGDSGWNPAGSPAVSRVAGFATAASVAAGDAVVLRYGSNSALDIDLYRLGWYGGSGGRLVDARRSVPPSGRFSARIDPATHRAEASGGGAVTIPTDRDWVPGVHTAVLRPVGGGPPRWLPIIVRAPSSRPRAPILFVCATATWQAYNSWGGADLYTLPGAAKGLDTGATRATQVSFDRPYSDAWGLGTFARWELNFVRWQERTGQPVDYCADVDLELHPEVVSGRRLILLVGHSEYWSRPMRTTIEGAIATGTSVAFLSANEVYWQTRLEDSPLGVGRRVTCYKSARTDPLAATRPELTTCRWREPPVNDPEAPLVGQMYGGIVNHVVDWVVAGSGHWLYERTGLRDGDRIRNLVGQEYDTYYPDLAQPGTTILASSPVDASPKPPASIPVAPMDARLQTATSYEADSGATVVAAGTFQWSWAIDRYGGRSYHGVSTPIDPRVAIMTRNIFDRLG